MRNARFGPWLREMRLKAGITMGTVAEALNVSVVYISDIERSRRQPPPIAGKGIDSYKKLAEVIKVDYSNLMQLAVSERTNLQFGDDVPEEARDLALTMYRKVNDGTLTPSQVLKIEDFMKSLESEERK